MIKGLPLSEEDRAKFEQTLLTDAKKMMILYKMTGSITHGVDYAKTQRRRAKNKVARQSRRVNR